jgi:obg-like ATPase 1
MTFSQFLAGFGSYVAAQKEAQEKHARKNPQMKLPPLHFQVMEKVTKMLESNKSLSGGDWTPAEVEKINEILPGALTTKPVVYLVNLSKKDFVRRKNKHLAKIKVSLRFSSCLVLKGSAALD